jgi:hypothetical protein
MTLRYSIWDHTYDYDPCDLIRFHVKRKNTDLFLQQSAWLTVNALQYGF